MAVATAGDVSVFKNGRQFAAWLGLVPKQNSSGGKTSTQTTPMFEWIYKLQERRPNNVVAVAIAAKQARMLWVIMAKPQRQDTLGSAI